MDTVNSPHSTSWAVCVSKVSPLSCLPCIVSRKTERPWEFKKGKEQWPFLFFLPCSHCQTRQIRYFKINTRVHTDLSWRRFDTTRDGQENIFQTKVCCKTWWEPKASIGLKRNMGDGSNKPPMPCPLAICTDKSSWTRWFPQFQIWFKCTDFPLKVCFQFILKNSYTPKGMGKDSRSTPCFC